jgi:hypothetical protein
MITKLAKKLDALEKELSEIKSLLKAKKKPALKKKIKSIISSDSASEVGCHRSIVKKDSSCHPHFNRSVKPLDCHRSNAGHC